MPDIFLSASPSRGASSEGPRFSRTEGQSPGRLIKSVLMQCRRHLPLSRTGLTKSQRKGLDKAQRIPLIFPPIVKGGEIWEAGVVDQRTS